MIDVLAFSPHPDDAELGAAGFLLDMKEKYTTGIVDLTRGELSSTATPDVRLREAEKASLLLGLSVRRNVNLGDCHLFDTYETRVKVADLIREFKPRIILAPYGKDRHPDHAACSHIVKNALVLARLKKLGEPHYVSHLYYYLLNTPFHPSFIVDISRVFPQKMEVLSCYSSQFSADYPYLRDYLPHVEAKARYYGALIDADYGEPFLAEGFLKVRDPLTL